MSPMPARPTPKPDPLKVRLLVDLLRERPRTYQELSQHEALGLKQRMLQHYITKHLPAAGHKIQRISVGRAPVRFSLSTDADLKAEKRQSERALRVLARGVLEGFFPLEGTLLERRERARVFAFASGVPRFSEMHRMALLRWITAAEEKPPAPCWLNYKTPERRLVWPLGVLLRDGRRVYLQGLVEPGDNTDHTRAFALERVIVTDQHCGVERVSGTVLVEPPPFLRPHPPHPSTLIDAPFSIIRPKPANAVHVHVRVCVAQVEYLQGRIWHARQTEQHNPDNTLDISFGPIDRDEAVAWCSQWWQGLTVLGDDDLRAAYEASLRDRLARQQAVAAAR